MNTVGVWGPTIIFDVLYSKYLYIRTYFLDSQAETGSYFKGTKTNNIRVYRGSFLKGDLCRPFQSLKKDFQPYCLS